MAQASFNQPNSEDPGAEPVSEETVKLDARGQQEGRDLSRQAARPPATVPGYQILKPLGQGAFGSVWLAREQNTGKLVAIKFYLHRRGLDWSLLSREVEKLAVLYTSRNIVGLLGVGWTSEPPFYIMEYLENGSLEHLLAEGPLPAAEAVRMTLGVLHGLIHAHGSGILHCDLKPANILLDQEFEPRLCDFGQSRLSYEQDPALGTLFYMAPEQADLRAVPDARWDVYALGALMYHMACGHPPHKSEENERLIRNARKLDDRLAVYRRILCQSSKPVEHRKLPGMDKRLAEVIERCLRVDPEKRFPNSQAVLDALELRERTRSRRPLIALGFVGPLLLLLLMIFMVGNLMRNAVQTAHYSVSERALKSNALSSRILARSLEQELEARGRELAEVAADPELRDLIERLEPDLDQNRQALNEFLNAKRDASQSHVQRDEQDLSWFMTDADGFQRWRSPWSDKTIDHRYAHRDYFHGLGADLADREASYAPIQDVHISIAFRSEAVPVYMVAITVPVWDAEGKRVIGLLGRTQELGRLQRYYGRRMESKGDSQVRIIALVDRRADWRLLDHPWMTREHLTDHGEQLEDLRLDETAIANLQGVYGTPEKPLAENVEFAIDHYQDPVGQIQEDGTEAYRGVWLAAVCPIGETGWFAVVQEPREQAYRPVEDMRRGLVKSGWWAIGLCFSLIGVLWFFVIRAVTARSVRLVGRVDDGDRTLKPRTGVD